MFRAVSPSRSLKASNCWVLTLRLTDQLSVSGGGSASPATVSFPGAYKATDPGILVNIYQALSSYADPGPAVYSGGLTRTAGSKCAAPAANETPGATTPSGGSGSGSGSGTGSGSGSGSGATPTTLKTSPVASPTAGSGSGSGGGAACSVVKYGQCGGNGYTGCTACAAGTTCVAVSAPYYSQCQ